MGHFNRNTNPGYKPGKPHEHVCSCGAHITAPETVCTACKSDLEIERAMVDDYENLYGYGVGQLPYDV